MPEVEATRRLSEEQIEGMRRQFGRIKHVLYNGVELVFRKPKRVEVKAHRMKSHSDNAAEKADADEQLAQLLVEHCNGASGQGAKQAFLDLLEEYPYAVSCREIGSALSNLTGVVQDAEVKTSGNGSPAREVPPTTTQGG